MACREGIARASAEYTRKRSDVLFQARMRFYTIAHAQTRVAFNIMRESEIYITLLLYKGR